MEALNGNFNPLFLSTYREAVGVFETIEDLDGAVSELERLMPRHDISVLGNTENLKEKWSINSLKTSSLEDSPYAPRSVSIRPQERVIGATVIIGICAYIFATTTALLSDITSPWSFSVSILLGSLTGVCFGALIVSLVQGMMKKRIEARIRDGGLILWVRTPGPEEEKAAMDIMRRHSGKNVRIHIIA